MIPLPVFLKYLAWREAQDEQGGLPSETLDAFRAFCVECRAWKICIGEAIYTYRAA